MYSTCSPDIILLIFKFLDYNSLVICLSVCTLWRDVVDYIAQANGLWDKLAQDAMYNKGITFKQKSNLTWQEIYFNSLLWNRKNIYFQLDNILNLDHIKNIHIFKDNIIIVLDSVVKYHTVDTLTKILEKPYLLDRQESDHITAELIAGNNLSIKFKHSELSFNANCYDFKLLDDRCFVVDIKNVLWLYKCCEKRFLRRPIMRSYENLGSIYNINVCNNVIYILKVNGNILLADDWDMEVKTIGKVNTLYFFNSPVSTMFQRYSVVYSVPRQNGSKLMNTLRIGDSEELALECPGMTCATSHGEVLFLGYDDGDVGICHPKKVLSHGNPKLQFNIKDIANCTFENPAITALDIYEARGMHYLFIATQRALFKVGICHPKKVLSHGNPKLQFNIKDIANCTFENPAITALDIYEARGMHYLFIATQRALFKVILTHNSHK